MYATRAELRAIDGLGDDSVHSDADLDTALAFAKETIDDFTGTSFGNVTSPAFDPFEVELTGNGLSVARLKTDDLTPIMYIRTVDVVTISGEVSASTFTIVDRIGHVRTSDSFTRADNLGEYNVTITGTAGRTDTPSHGIRWCTRTIARNWLLNLHSRLPDRALNLTTAEGSYEVRAQAGGVGRPTAMPDVNAELNRHRVRWAV